MNWFHEVFKSDLPDRTRDNFIARVLGLFGEQVVRIWCDAPRSPYSDLGRPRVVVPPSSKGYTLDFTLQSKQDGRCFVAEMKAWVAYQNHRYLMLRAARQLNEARTPTFEAFLKAARTPSRCKVSVGGEKVRVNGGILVWADASAGGKAAVRRAYGIAQVLSLREIIEDLVAWKDKTYRSFLGDRLQWCEHLLRGLARGGLGRGATRRCA